MEHSQDGTLSAHQSWFTPIILSSFKFTFACHQIFNIQIIPKLQLQCYLCVLLLLFRLLFLLYFVAVFITVR